MLNQHKKYPDSQGIDRSWVLNANGNYKKIKVTRKTTVLPCRYMDCDPCMICGYHNSYYRTIVSELNENGKEIVKLTLEHCLECSELSSDDMLRKCRR